jgi:hypothetical protein
MPRKGGPGGPRGPVTGAKETTMARSVRAARRTGGVERVRVYPDGCAEFVLASGEASADTNNKTNPWDEALKDAADEKRTP